MSKVEFSSLNKAIFEQISLPDDAVIVDLGCRDAKFLLSFLEAFPNKIKKAIGVDINDKGFKKIKYKKPIELKVMDCSKKLDFDDNTFDLVFTKDMFECLNSIVSPSSRYSQVPLPNKPSKVHVPSERTSKQWFSSLYHLPIRSFFLTEQEQNPVTIRIGIKIKQSAFLKFFIFHSPLF